MPDGNYRATIPPGAVTDDYGNPLAPTSFDFYVLGGDANRDRVVNFSDLLLLAKNYNRTGATFDQGDFNYDGVVNFSDLLILAKAYNKALPAPAAAPVLSAAPAMAPATAPVTATSMLSDDGDAKAKPVFSTTRVTKPAPPKPAPGKPKAVAKPKGR